VLDSRPAEAPLSSQVVRSDGKPAKAASYLPRWRDPVVYLTRWRDPTVNSIYIHVEYMWSICGVHQEYVYVEYMWSICGVYVEYIRSM
jgi:hypothetical protein